MDKVIRDAVDWEQPFPPEEYAARREKVRAASESAGYDGILVTAPRDYYYLCGHDHIWQYRYAVTGLFFDTQSASFLFFDNASHRNIISTTPEIKEVIYGPRRGSVPEHIRSIASQLIERGRARGKIAIQTRGYGLHPDFVRMMGGLLADAGADIVEDSELIEDVRLIKSSEEIKVMRDAAEVCTSTMAAAREVMGPGVMETEIDAVICSELMRRGCGHSGIRNMIASGARSGNHHSPASHRRLKSGDVAHIDFCASMHRYHVNLSRSFVVERIDPRWHDLMDRSAGCSQAIVDGVHR